MSEDYMGDCVWFVDYGGWGECSYPEKYECDEYCPEYEPKSVTK